MQIAKMFASLGFNVDTKGLDTFKKSLASARSEVTNLSRGAKTSTRQLRGLRNVIDQVNSRLNKLQGNTTSKNIGRTYNSIAASVRRVDTALQSISNNRTRTTQALGKIHASVKAGQPIWDNYRSSVVKTRQALRNVNGEMKRLRANSTVNLKVNRKEGSSGGRGGRGGGSSGRSGGFIDDMFRGFLPATLAMGGGASVGYLGAAGVEASRDQTRMESMLLMTARNTNEFGDTLKYVREEALRLGLSSTELGKSFAQINMAAKSLSLDEKKEMFTGFSEFMMAMGTGADDQKGIFRAFNQMFSNNRILQEEINQLSERGIPATLVYDAAMKAYGTDNMQYIKTLQKDGQLDPSKVLPEMARMLQEKAHTSGALEKMQKSSMYQQGVFFEQLRQTSKEIMDGGLDEWLGKIFAQLTELTATLTDVADGIKWIVEQGKILKDGIDELTNGHTIFAFILTVLFFRMGRLKGAFKAATKALKKQKGILRALSAFMQGTFGRTLGKIITRFGGWITVIWGAWKALKALGEMADRRDRGEYTALDAWQFKMEKFLALTKLAKAELRLTWAHMVAFGKDPIKYFTGESATGFLSDTFSQLPNMFSIQGGGAKLPNSGNSRRNTGQKMQIPEWLDMSKLGNGGKKSNDWDFFNNSNNGRKSSVVRLEATLPIHVTNSDGYTRDLGTQRHTMDFNV